MTTPALLGPAAVATAGAAAAVASSATLAGGIALLCVGALASLLGLPALVLLVLWRSTRDARERAAAGLRERLPERHQGAAARVAPVLLWLLDRFVRRRLLPWLALHAAGIAALVAGIVLLVVW